MKKLLLASLSILLLIFISCGRETPVPDPELSSSSDLICKSQEPLKGETPGPNQTCVDWKYVDGRLLMTHFNAGFNCCPEAILTALRFSGDTLYVTERDSLQLCRCNCLYYVDLIIDNIQEKVYTIHFVEPFVIEPMEPLVFTIDLKKNSEGRVCQERDYYPWRN